MPTYNCPTPALLPAENMIPQENSHNLSSEILPLEWTSGFSSKYLLN